MKTNDIVKPDWEFFGAVARAAFANPFGERRDELDFLIAGVPKQTPSEKLLEAVIFKVGEKVAALRQTGGSDLRKWSGEERETLQAVFLFHIFHRFVDDFDRLIREQEKRGDSPCPVHFARECLHALEGFGISGTESERFFAVFYQMRRAYYFIRNGLVGGSASMKTLRKHLWDCVFTHDIRWFENRLWNRMEDFSVLLLGETGTGKGAAAAAIGRSGFIPFDSKRNCFSESFTRNFLSINLSQYSEGVLESELFGHKKGAFTGAVENHEGVFSRCAPHGVIFLDEVGDVSVPVQIKLLLVLQERVFYPVGSHEARRFSGRVVAATNRPLDLLRREGKFRDDFYYRLCSDVLVMPTLRQRLSENARELDVLLASILSRIAGDFSSKERQVVRKVLERDLGTGYPWPGNVRELEQAVKRVILTGHYHGEAPTAKGNDGMPAFVEKIQRGNLEAEEMLSTYCALLYKEVGTYEEVARRTNLDRRTVKKYVDRSSG